jgi:hypothetical protein
MLGCSTFVAEMAIDVSSVFLIRPYGLTLRRSGTRADPIAL